MSTLHRTRTAAVVLVTMLVAAGCGDTGAAPAHQGTTGSPADHAGDGVWLLRFTTATGADAEKSGAVYVTYNPTTGAATTRAVPGTNAADASQDEQVLLVSADHAWAIPDTGVPNAQAHSGRLVLYSVTSDATETIDIRSVTGDPHLRAVAWAFDPSAADVLRVVDSAGDVWKVDLAARSATRERRLPRRPGWIFGNGFDNETGEPYIESIDSDRTDPAGNGDSDTRPVERQGGTLVRYDGTALSGLPKPPCGFAGGFRFDGGTAWLFCADTPSIAAYQVAAGGASWHRFGTPSAKVVPGVAVDLTFALPPLG